MYVSILIPTFNRKKFSELISHNIKIQKYPFIKEIIVADDGDENERLILDVPYTVLYYRVERMTIGQKRNFLIEKATGDYLAHFDTDDMYSPYFLSSSIFNLIKTGKELSGSADMCMYDTKTKKTFKQRCIMLNMLNEATMVYTRQYANTHKFSNNMTSEGIDFCDIRKIIETDIDKIMVCLSHGANSVDKTIWINKNYEEKLNMKQYNQHIHLISLLTI